MGKKLLVALLFCAFQCSFSSTFASNGLTWRNEPTPPETFCDVPAPENFQVTSRGPDFITLSWGPISVGVTYSLIVSIKTNEAWVPVSTFSHIPASSYTVENIGFDDEVLLSLATECSSGERSINVIELKPKIILELSVPGRIPVSPQVLKSCKNIKLSDHQWVGFSVKKHGGTWLESNTFEVVVTGDQNVTNIDVQRISSETVIYAVNDDNVYPPPTIGAPNPFRISDFTNPILPTNIGKVGIVVTYNPERLVSICQAPNPIWDGIYDFKVLVADLTTHPNNNPKEHSSETSPCKTTNNFKAISPFSETLHVFMKCPEQSKENVFICLINIAGQLILEHQITTPEEPFFIPTDTIPTGIYALQLKTGNHIQTIKVVKVNF